MFWTHYQTMSQWHRRHPFFNNKCFSYECVKDEVKTYLATLVREQRWEGHTMCRKVKDKGEGQRLIPIRVQGKAEINKNTTHAMISINTTETNTVCTGPWKHNNRMYRQLGHGWFDLSETVRQCFILYMVWEMLCCYPFFVFRFRKIIFL